jgi:hypothetical protein
MTFANWGKCSSEISVKFGFSQKAALKDLEGRRFPTPGLYFLTPSAFMASNGTALAFLTILIDACNITRWLLSCKFEKSNSSPVFLIQICIVDLK